ncbi:alpha/beta hydrolase-fold protein [Alteromonas ponticola]|uniref:Alpha/beta hydrolase-fold protein n=1 Tax=Alteromonas aquimaris TaxID=2998417 RepID=A0ABT3P487_9ALTE|nr:alpha/beta hydrolase-fold protein [Alteromonas aquimaris]MCW8107537.1 alpha/beta hydrolase-fold protein [Alteromonas aquimaris]
MQQAIFKLIAFLLLVISCELSAESTEAPMEYLHGLGKVDYFLLEDVREDDSIQVYHIYVRNSPSAADGHKLPTIYLLDGGINFPLLSAYYQLLRLMNTVPEMLIVGISYGTSDWKKGNARAFDFTLPAKKQQHWGGAKKFEAFLAHSLIPRIEQHYPADPHKRILFGQSVGGQFGLYTSMYGESPFHAIIASNPALHENLPLLITPIQNPTDRPMAYISLAENDSARFRQPALKWSKHWFERSPDWKRKVVHLEQHDHLSANPEAFRQGLRWIFAQPSF